MKYKDANAKEDVKSASKRLLSGKIRFDGALNRGGSPLNEKAGK